MARRTTAVAKVENEDGYLTEIPDWAKEEGPKGAEDISQDALEIPRLVLLQGVSPQLEENDNLRPGDYFHIIANDSIGKEFVFVPCYCSEAVILWRPREDGGGILARSHDGKTWDVPNQSFDVEFKDGAKVTWDLKGNVQESGLTEFGSAIPGSEKNTQPAATRMINVACYLPNHPDLSPVVLTFQRTGYKIGKRFMANLRMGAAPTYGRAFRASSVKETNADGESYLEQRVTPIGFVSEEVAAITRDIYEQFKRMGLRVKESDEAPRKSEAATEAEDY